MTEELDLTVFDPFTALAAEVQAKDASQEFDLATEEGEKALRKYIREVKSNVIGIEKIRVAAKANALAYGKEVDKKAKEFKAPFMEIVTERTKPLDEIEDAKRKAAEAIVEAERVAEEKAEADRLAALKRREDEVARTEAEQKVAEETANAEQAEADRVIREKKIAETATKLAEANAAREAKKLREAIEATAKRKAAIEEAGRQIEIKEVAFKKKQAVEKEAKRVADESHRTKIHRAIEGFLRDYILDAEASVITEELIAGNVPNVKIIY